MATTQPGAETTLHLSRTFKAPAKRVFEAWTRPEVMNEWMAPGPDSKCVSSSDAKLGGRYKVAMHLPDGSVHTAFGEYTEFNPYTRLAFTWSWEDSATKDTLVTVDFIEQGGQTEMRLTHERFQDSETRDKHGEGWAGCIANLESLLGG